MQHGADIDVDEQVDVLRQGLEQLARLVDARVVHEDIEVDRPAEARQGGRVGHVDRVGHAARTGRQGFECVAAARQRMDLDAFGRQALDHGSADAR